LLGIAEGAVDQRGRDPTLYQRIDLVLHERDQRGHDNGQAWTHQARQLVTEAFASASRHDAQAIVARYHVADYLALALAEIVQAKALQC
jgi:hypothetical protein